MMSRENTGPRVAGREISAKLARMKRIAMAGWLMGSAQPEIAGGTSTAAPEMRPWRKSSSASLARSSG